MSFNPITMILGLGNFAAAGVYFYQGNAKLGIVFVCYGFATCILSWAR